MTDQSRRREDAFLEGKRQELEGERGRLGWRERWGLPVLDGLPQRVRGDPSQEAPSFVHPRPKESNLYLSEWLLPVHPSCRKTFKASGRLNSAKLLWLPPRVKMNSHRLMLFPSQLDGEKMNSKGSFREQKTWFETNWNSTILRLSAWKKLSYFSVSSVPLGTVVVVESVQKEKFKQFISNKNLHKFYLCILLWN